VAVPTTLAVTGTYGQIDAFINALDGFPRLFVIQNFTLASGTTAATASTGGASSGGTGTSSLAGQPPLWTGGKATSAGSGPYTLTIQGSIYYTSSPSALDACTKATAAAVH
jgi:hypothetical protein